jgi:hypothetical protein
VLIVILGERIWRRLLFGFRLVKISIVTVLGIIDLTVLKEILKKSVDSSSGSAEVNVQRLQFDHLPVS